MDIPNLSQTTYPTKKPSNFSPLIAIIVIVVAVTVGFWSSRFFPSSSKGGLAPLGSNVIPIEDVKNKDDLQVGKVYGDAAKSFKDSATGVIQKGNINGEGTHILVREGGDSQRASLTSSTVDLDLFVGRKVEVKGETNASNKTAWLLDVGSIKILE